MPISLQDLKQAAGVLRRAKSLCETVRDLFLGHDTDAAARMGDICQRIDDEHEFIQRRIAKASPNGGGNNG
jgi:phosphate uptake regulator